MPPVPVRALGYAAAAWCLGSAAVMLLAVAPAILGRWGLLPT